MSDWPLWMSFDIPAGTAADFFAHGVGSETARQWIDTGSSVQDLLAFVDGHVPLDVSRAWIAIDVSTADALAFINSDVSPATAREWMDAGMSPKQALAFLDAGVPLVTAQEWAEAGLDAWDAVEFIEKGVSLEEAAEFEESGIGPHQVTRTEAGLVLDLDPWQEDPVAQLPDVIEAGRIALTFWTTALGGDPVAHDVSFTWDGNYTQVV